MTTTAIPLETVATLDRQLDRAALLDLTLLQLRALVILHRHGPATMTVVSRSLGIATASMTCIADSLSAIGLLERTPHRTDRRVHILSITPKGIVALSDILLA